MFNEDLKEAASKKMYSCKIFKEMWLQNEDHYRTRIYLKENKVVTLVSISNSYYC